MADTARVIYDGIGRFGGVDAKNICIVAVSDAIGRWGSITNSASVGSGGLFGAGLAAAARGDAKQSEQ